MLFFSQKTIDNTTISCYNINTGGGLFMTYFDRIKELRKEAKLTQAQMAEYLGISQQGYALYESGKRKIDFETLLKNNDKL